MYDLLSASEGLIGHGTGVVNVNGTQLPSRCSLCCLYELRNQSHRQDYQLSRASILCVSPLGSHLRKATIKTNNCAIASQSHSESLFFVPFGAKSSRAG